MAQEDRILPGCLVLPAMDDELAPSKGKPKKRRTKHSTDRFSTLNSFVDQGMRLVRCSQATVWLVLFRDTKPDGLACASEKDIAHRCGISERTVRRAIRDLVQVGLLIVVRRGGLGRSPSIYQVHPIGGQKRPVRRTKTTS